MKKTTLEESKRTHNISKLHVVEAAILEDNVRNCYVFERAVRERRILEYCVFDGFVEQSVLERLTRIYDRVRLKYGVLCSDYHVRRVHRERYVAEQRGRDGADEHPRGATERRRKQLQKRIPKLKQRENSINNMFTTQNIYLSHEDLAY